MFKALVKIFFVSLLVVAAFIGGYWFGKYPQSEEIVREEPPKEKPLEIYAIKDLQSARFLPGEFTITDLVSDEENYKVYYFSYKFAPNPSKPSELRSTTGQINIPYLQSDNKLEKYPIVFMLRGYVDQEIYQTGVGTKNAAAYFAENGFITIAPDFLGYAGSDTEATNIFESRFQTYTTAVSLLTDLRNLDRYSFGAKTVALWDGKNIFIWGHSNGGQIALTTLEITKVDYPTVLWAPVSKPFPYSVLYYTDESADGGKLIRSELSKFEADYDVEDYSLVNFINSINATLQIHQGTSDDAVPYEWTDELVDKLDDLNIDVDYYKYPGADHNLRPSWDTAVARSLQFFNSNID